MKRIIFIVALMFGALLANAQTPLFEVSGIPIAFSDIIKVDSTLTKDKLYTAGLEWFAKAYNNSKFVLQMQDKDAGILIGKASFSYLFSYSTTRSVDYTIKISFKDAKLKYEISDFISSDYGLMKDGEVTKAPWVARSTLKKYYGKTQAACNGNAKDLIGYLQGYYSKLTLKSDW